MTHFLICRGFHSGSGDFARSTRLTRCFSPIGKLRVFLYRVGSRVERVERAVLFMADTKSSPVASALDDEMSGREDAPIVAFE